MAAEPQVAAILVRRLVDVLVERGIDRDALLRRADLAPAALRITRLRLPWRMVEELVEAAEDLAGDDRLGFHIARAHDLETLEIPGFLFLASRTLGDAMRRLQRVQRLWSDAYRGELLPDPPRFSYTLLRPERRASAHLREQAFADMLMMVRQLVGLPVAPVEIRFTHHRTGDIAEYEDFFACPVRFGAGCTEMVLREDQLQAPLATANPLFVRHFEQQAEEELAKLQGGRTLSERVQALLEEDFERLCLAESSVESVALRLRTRPRTLQRALSNEGTSFARELERMRRNTSERLLLAGQDIAEVSWRLGYAEPTVFHRAFKRWTGQTPEAFRQARTG